MRFDPTTKYHDGILEQLLHHGIVPRATTPPDLAYEHLKSLYCFRIRELKRQRRELEDVLGPQPLDTYRRQLEALRAEYPALKIPPHHWRVRSPGPGRRNRNGDNSPGEADSPGEAKEKREAKEKGAG